MYTRSTFTTTTPLPSYTSRESALGTLHNHQELIELNPLVIHHDKCDPPPQASANEAHYSWYEIADRISYLPWGLMQGKVTYKGCFHDFPRGTQTHVYAPMGLDIRTKWSVGGNMPGEPREPVDPEMSDPPTQGLYLQEDVDMQCPFLVSGFVRSTLARSHSTLVERLAEKGREGMQ